MIVDDDDRVYNSWICGSGGFVEVDHFCEEGLVCYVVLLQDFLQLILEELLFGGDVCLRFLDFVQQLGKSPLYHITCPYFIIARCTLSQLTDLCPSKPCLMVVAKSHTQVHTYTH